MYLEMFSFIAILLFVQQCVGKKYIIRNEQEMTITWSLRRHTLAYMQKYPSASWNIFTGNLQMLRITKSINKIDCAHFSHATLCNFLYCSAPRHDYIPDFIK